MSAYDRLETVDFKLRHPPVKALLCEKRLQI
jgi:hypothetical protein